MIWLTVKTMRVDREFREDQQETELARRRSGNPGKDYQRPLPNGLETRTTNCA